MKSELVAYRMTIRRKTTMTKMSLTTMPLQLPAQRTSSKHKPSKDQH